MSQRHTRSRDTVELLQQKQIDTFNEQVRMLDSKKQGDQAVLEQLRKKCISSFRMVFKIKVVDTKKTECSAIVTLYD